MPHMEEIGSGKCAVRKVVRVGGEMTDEMGMNGMNRAQHFGDFPKTENLDATRR